MTKERIGFIGLGIMGKRMALNLLKAGYSMTIRSGNEETRSEFAAKGVRVVHTPAGVAAESDVIITMLPGSPEVEEVVLGVFCKREILKGGCGQNLGLFFRDGRMSMYSREKRLKAVELYIKYDKSAADVIRELGYPDRHTLRSWYGMYLKEQETGVIHDRYMRASKFTEEQKGTAVRHYLDHGRNYSRTVRLLGYPNRVTLRQWCLESAPEGCKKRKGRLHYTEEQKREAVEALCTRECSAREVADAHEVSRPVLYQWKNALLGKEAGAVMTDAENGATQKTKEELLDELASLKKEIKQLKLERDVLRVAAEIIKKDPGVDLKHLANREKTLLVDALRNEHPLKELLDCVKISRSSYFYQHGRLLAEDKYGEVKEKIGRLFEENGGRYGYRRIHALLRREGERLSEKIVRRIMTENAFVVFGRKKRKYSSYQGEKTPGAENLISRDFHADAPNIKWLTDITEFPLPAGKVYLSPIVDCFDGMVVSWTIGTSPDAGLVNSMLDMATATLGERERPVVHSDRGAHYRWPGWIERMEAAGLTRSMSKKGCSPDNAACEGFFGRLKNEMFYNRKWQGVSIEEFMDILDNYLHWYNEKRIKISLGAKSPLEYRRSLDLAA